MACTRRCAKFGPREQALARRFPVFPRMLNLMCVAMTPDLPTVACALNRGPDGCTSYWTMRAGGPIPIWLREGPQDSRLGLWSAALAQSPRGSHLEPPPQQQEYA